MNHTKKYKHIEIVIAGVAALAAVLDAGINLYQLLKPQNLSNLPISVTTHDTSDCQDIFCRPPGR